jgi:hypothetical protein
MRAYVRTSRRTALSLPWYVALPAMLLWVSVMVVVALAGLVVLIGLAVFHVGQRAWVRRRAA